MLIILYLHQIHVILVSIAVVQILRVCTEVMGILNVPVIQVSSEMGETVVLVSFQNYHTFSVESMSYFICCGFVSRAGLTQAKKEGYGELRTSCVPQHCIVWSNHVAVLFTRQVTSLIEWKKAILKGQQRTFPLLKKL